MKENKVKKLLPVLVVILVIVAVLWLPATYIIGAFFAEEPDMTYMEFPMEITYEINGDVVTRKEIFVVKYLGLDPSIGYTYKGYIKGTEEKGIVLYEEDDLKVICELGTVDHFLGKYGGYEDGDVPMKLYCQEEKGFLLFKKEVKTDLTEGELYRKYGIKIISWTTAEPFEDYWSLY